MAVKVCLIGYGRMGKTIEKLSSKHQCEVHCIVDKDAEWDLKKMKECDVAIEFSTPSSAVDNIRKCIQIELPIISGTTGWLDSMESIKSLLIEHPSSAFMYGSNFSLGVNLFFRINKLAAEIMRSDPSMSVEVMETHHTSKIDKPSGTAITIAQEIVDTRDDKSSWILDSANSDDDIVIRSFREVDVAGTHEVVYESDIDKISLIHEAKSREGFASGALKAATWLVGRKGYFDISDYIDDLLKNQL